jgi:hypothetical protein
MTVASPCLVDARCKNEEVKGRIASLKRVQTKLLFGNGNPMQFACSHNECSVAKKIGSIATVAVALMTTHPCHGGAVLLGSERNGENKDLFNLSVDKLREEDYGCCRWAMM